MTEFKEGTPCWADAMFADLEGATRFYGDVLGWTFGESDSAYGNYTQAFADGKAVAAIVPQMPGEETQSAWCLYFASADAAATVAKVKAAGGQVVMEPMKVGDFGTMALAKEPTGAAFGIWQPERHKGFEKIAEPGAYGWAEVFTRDAETADAFLTAVFPYQAQKIADEHMDFKVFSVGDKSNVVLGRMKMGEEFPPDVPSYVNVYFVVDDCDATVKKAADLGAKLQFGPMSSPYGRFAALSDPQGAHFTVIDITATEGDMPAMADA
jgi:predicted enzyme related to lactoylglutathione lyase